MQNEIISYTQQNVGTNGIVQRRESAHSSAQVGGRSMIEMLGVLAIIGALSVGGLAALRVAQSKLRANVIANDAMLAAADVLPRLDILFQNANAASTTEELTPTFTPKSDTMEIWRCGTDGAEIIFNDVKKEVCENLMKIEKIKGIVSFGTAPNNAAACPDVPNNVELFGRCTDLNQMVFSVGLATELCGGRMCTSDEYCNYDTTYTYTPCSSGAGQCASKGIKPDSITAGGITFFGIYETSITWGSALSWCRAHGGRAVSASTISALSSSQLTELQNAVGVNQLWLAEDSSNCEAYLVDFGNNDNVLRSNGVKSGGAYPLCQE